MLMKLVASFILVDGLTKSISSERQGSAIAKLLQKWFPQSHYHPYDPFTRIGDISSESDFLEEQAQNLLQEISRCPECSTTYHNCRDAKGLPSIDRPIVFLGHDLGGSVVKKALLLAMEDPSCQSIARATRATFFFGVLHQASDSEPWDRQIRNLLSVSQRDVESIFGGIQTLPAALNSIAQSFTSISGSYATFNVYEKTGSNVVRPQSDGMEFQDHSKDASDY